MNWSDAPEVPIDDNRGFYESVFFVNYLAKRLGPEIVGEVWRSGERTPWQAIEKLQPQPLDALLRDYFREAFFLADSSSACHSPALLDRYLGRAVHQLIDLTKTEDAVSVKGDLDRQSCHYYRVTAHSTPTLRIKAGPEPFYVEVVGATKDGRVSRGLESANHWIVIASNSGITSSPVCLRYELEISRRGTSPV
jgi:hypothetical protein